MTTQAAAALCMRLHACICMPAVLRCRHWQSACGAAHTLSTKENAPVVVVAVLAPPLLPRNTWLCSRLKQGREVEGRQAQDASPLLHGKRG